MGMVNADAINHNETSRRKKEVEVEGKKKRNRFGRKEVKKIVTVLINNVHCVGTQRLIHNR